MTNLRGGAEYYLIFVLVLVLENFAGIALGMVLSAGIRSVEMAPQVTSLPYSQHCSVRTGSAILTSYASFLDRGYLDWVGTALTVEPPQCA